MVLETPNYERITVKKQIARVQKQGSEKEKYVRGCVFLFFRIFHMQRDPLHGYLAIDKLADEEEATSAHLAVRVQPVACSVCLYREHTGVKML